jgi:hypothetical protein
MYQTLYIFMPIIEFFIEFIYLLLFNNDTQSVCFFITLKIFNKIFLL